jgi:predicted DNA-binding transcriptional regulator AlpA
MPELIIPPDDRVLTFDEAADVSNFSVATLRRRIADGAGPRVVRLSTRRVGIRLRDLRAWLDANTSPAPAA